MRSTVVALAVVALVAAGCGGATGSTPEFRLAVADGSSPDGDGDPALAPYRAAFARLERICTDSRARMADRAVAIRDALHAMNIPDSTLAVLEEAAAYAAGRRTADRRSCARDFAAAQTLLELTGK